MPRIHTHNHRHRSPSIRRPLLALLTALFLAGCGSRSSSPTATGLALVEQLVSQSQLEQSQRAELERQL
ncbi:MAG: hypothetical protein NTY53_13780, partial [Kiritimatiellaeota bacterium]|nr:hypothetical protein [Kiritimatiellota bacterium]